MLELFGNLVIIMQLFIDPLRESTFAVVLFSPIHTFDCFCRSNPRVLMIKVSPQQHLKPNLSLYRLCQYSSSGDGFSVFGVWDFGVPLNLTSLSLLPFLSVSLQRIFSSFVYTEKTSNGETEVQQVSNKGFYLPVCVCARACLPACGWCLFCGLVYYSIQQQ